VESPNRDRSDGSWLFERAPGGSAPQGAELRAYLAVPNSEDKESQEANGEK
jgi:hypothetical protein